MRVPFLPCLLAASCVGPLVPDPTVDVDDGPPPAGEAPDPMSPVLPVRPEPVSEAPPAVSAFGGALDPAACTPRPVQVRRLTPSELESTVKAALGVDVDVAEPLEGSFQVPPGAFSTFSGVPQMGETQVETWMGVAEAVAAATRPADIEPCLETQIDELGCVGRVLDGAGRALFRRPLTDSERDAALAFWTAERDLDGPESAFTRLVEYLLLASGTLYRTELEAALSPSERAALLAYFLTGGPPDDALKSVEERLTDPAVIAAETRRLVRADATGRGQGLSRMLAEFFHVRDILDVPKPEALGFDDALRAAAVEESELFLREVLAAGQPSFSELFESPYTRVPPVLAELYGVEPSEAGAQVRLPPERVGILGKASFLAANARELETDIIHRGLYIRESLLCDPLPDPPANVDDAFPEIDGTKTHRERLLQHQSDPSCAACHTRIDPLAFPLEVFDARGAYRTIEPESNRTIDASGWIEGIRGEDRSFEGPVELARALSVTPEAAECLIRRTYEFALGAVEGAPDACVLYAMRDAFVASGGDLVETVVALTTHPDFFRRR
ncbi:MAG: DUF1588 domain-containing protein [Myxococcota bacterium]